MRDVGMQTERLWGALFASYRLDRSCCHVLFLLALAAPCSQTARCTFEVLKSVREVQQQEHRSRGTTAPPP
jgi:hypothetical protein